MIVERACADYTDFRIPGIVVTEKGTLIRYCECRRSSSDWADIDIKIDRSTDEGKTWETVLLIKSNGNTLNNPVIFVNGEQLVFFRALDPGQGRAGLSVYQAALALLINGNAAHGQHRAARQKTDGHGIGEKDTMDKLERIFEMQEFFQKLKATREDK